MTKVHLIIQPMPGATHCDACGSDQPFGGYATNAENWNKSLDKCVEDKVAVVGAGLAVRLDDEPLKEDQ